MEQDGNGLVGRFVIEKVASSSRSGSSKKGPKGAKGSKADYEIKILKGDVKLNVPLKGQVQESQLDVEVSVPIKPLSSLDVKIELTLTSEHTTVYNINFV